AGEHALGQHGYREAADHLTRALKLLEPLPDTPERRQYGLTLHVLLGSAQVALKGHAAPEVEETYARARELSAHVEDSPRLVSVLLGLGRSYLVRGSLDAAREVGQRLLTVAQATGDAAIFAAAHDALGAVSFYRGEFEAALAHLERAVEVDAPPADA